MCKKLHSHPFERYKVHERCRLLSGIVVLNCCREPLPRVCLHAGSHGYRLRFRRIYIVSVPYVAPEATHAQRYREVSNTRVDLRLV